MPRISGGWAKVRSVIKDRGAKRHERGMAKADAYVGSKFSLVKAFQRKPKEYKHKTPRTALDYFYSARAEAKRARRRRRNLLLMELGGMGRGAQERALQRTYQ